MKGCVAAVGILLLVGMLVAVNAVYVTQVSSTLEQMYRQLPAVPDPTVTPTAIRKMTDYLDRHETGLGFSIGFPILDGIQDRLARLGAYAEAGDASEYTATLAALESCITDLRRHERADARNLF